jgi:hypothetical protein
LLTYKLPVNDSQPFRFSVKLSGVGLLSLTGYTITLTATLPTDPEDTPSYETTTVTLADDTKSALINIPPNTLSTPGEYTVTIRAENLAAADGHTWKCKLSVTA